MLMRVAGLVVALGFGSLPVPAVAAPPYMQLIERIDAAPRAMKGTMRIGASDDATTAVVLSLRRHGSRTTVERATRYESAGIPELPSVYGPGAPDTSQVCTEVDSCFTSTQYGLLGDPFRVSSDDAPTTLAFLIASAGGSVFVNPGRGWRIRWVRGGSLVKITNRAAGGSGAAFGRVSVEHFTGAAVKATGQSVAFAAIPCPPDPYLFGRPGGEGQAVLYGGDPGRGPQAMRCADRTWFSYAIASRSTRWELRGDVRGYTSQRVRLAVLVLPKMPYSPAH